MHIFGIYIPNFMDWSNHPHFLSNWPKRNDHGTYQNMEKSSTNGYRTESLIGKTWGYRYFTNENVRCKTNHCGDTVGDIRGYKGILTYTVHQFDIRQKLDHPKQQFIWESWWNSPKELWNIYEYLMNYLHYLWEVSKQVFVQDPNVARGTLDP